MTLRIQHFVSAIQKAGRQGRSRRRTAICGVVFPALVSVLGMGGVASVPLEVRTQAQDQVPADAAQRQREQWRAWQRDAVRDLEAADDRAASPSARADVLARLADTLGRLGTPPQTDAPASPVAPLLPPDLQAALRSASTALREVASGADTQRPDTLAAARTARGVDAAALRALLEQVRTRLDEVALGLTFQGTYSRTSAPEPVLGGHATAMGPAPAAPPPPPPDATASAIRFEARDPLPTRTWAGGPTKDHILESAGNGVALFDYDGDGWLDIYLVTAAQLTPTRERIPHRNALYRNLGNWQFEDVSARAGVDFAAWGNGACAGDADGDGHLDLYVTNWGPNVLFRNRGDGTFEDIAPQAGVEAGGWSTGCAFFDADGDGDLDLYVARYVETTWDDLVSARRTLTWRNGPKVMVGPAGLPGESDLYFENLGDGRFRESSAARGLADTARAYGFGVVTTDIDGDGHVDLFVANDSNPNFLYRNLGDGTFESIGLLAGVAVNGEARAQAGMGADAGDADDDGRMDLVLTAFAHDRNSLYRNLGGALFEDASVASGLAASTFTRMGWGVAFADVDLDGHADLVVANGHIFADIGDFPALGEDFAQKNQVLRNVGGQFVDVSDTAGPGLQVEKVSRGLAIGDLDNDGDPDIIVSNMDDVPTVLENRQEHAHHWVGIGLTAPSGNRFGIGAVVTVTANGRSQVREVRSGGSYLSQSDLRVLFGLAADAGPATVEVRMPGGHRWRWTNLAADRYHTLALTEDARLREDAR